MNKLYLLLLIPLVLVGSYFFYGDGDSSPAEPVNVTISIDGEGTELIVRVEELICTSQNCRFEERGSHTVTDELTIELPQGKYVFSLFSKDKMLSGIGPTEIKKNKHITLKVK